MPMAMEVSTSSVVCCRCGMKYAKRNNYFPVSYAASYKGVGFLPVCKKCVDAMYNEYISQCGNPKSAVRQMCRKLDLYWNEDIFDWADKQSNSRSIIFQYIKRTNNVTYAGKCYDDTLTEEYSLWNFDKGIPDEETNIEPETEETNEDTTPKEKVINTPQEVIDFWGTGYSDEMYEELEQRRRYWMSRLPNDIELDIGTEAIIRQICSLEIDINRDRVAGKPVDKSVNALNSLLGSANLKPVQQKTDTNNNQDNTPFGVWIKKFEDDKPIPEVDPELKDTDNIIKYISTWFFGHLSKMLGIKNAHSKLYDKEIEKLRVEHPEYEGDDDDSLLYDVFSDDEDSEVYEESESGDDG